MGGYTGRVLMHACHQHPRVDGAVKQELTFRFLSGRDTARRGVVCRRLNERGRGRGRGWRRHGRRSSNLCGTAAKRLSRLRVDGVLWLGAVRIGSRRPRSLGGVGGGYAIRGGKLAVGPSEGGARSLGSRDEKKLWKMTRKGWRENYWKLKWDLEPNIK